MPEEPSLGKGTMMMGGGVPQGVVIGSLEYVTVDGRLTVTDGKVFSLDVNEFGPMR